MFKKLKDSKQYSIRDEFLKTFGDQCLDKILTIERKLHSKYQDYENHSFQATLVKIKVLMDSYQIIAHQIFHSCESALLDGLGQSVLKMYLQMSSAIKWIIKSFMIRRKTNQQDSKTEEGKTKQNQSEKFRRKQIDRFMLRGVMQQLNEQENEEDQWQEGIRSIFGTHNKFNIERSKKKALQVSSSNAPEILLDTINQFTKTSQYINKFVSLRQNYQECYRVQHPPTSQLIIQNSMILKNSQATQKFKTLCDKLIGFQNQKKVEKVQQGIQVENIMNQAEKNKKIAQKNKIKLLMEELEKQKNNSKTLKLQLDLFEKKYLSTVKQNSELEHAKKKMAQSTRFKSKRYDGKHDYNRQDKENSREKSFNVTMNPIEQIKQIIKETTEISQINRLSKDREKYTLNMPMERRPRFMYTKMNSSKSLKNISSSNFIGLDSNKQNTNLDIQNNVYNIEIYEPITRKTNKEIEVKKQLEISSSVSKFQANFINNSLIITYTNGDGKVYNEVDNKIDMDEKSRMSYLLRNKKFFVPDYQNGYANGQINGYVNGQGTPFPNGYSNGYTSTSNSVFSEQFNNQKSRKTKQSSVNGKDLRMLINMNNMSNLNSMNSSYKISEKNRSLQSFFLESKIQTLQYSNEVQIPFDRIYKAKEIKFVDLSSNTIRQFFIDEGNAKNYELLNLTQLCSGHKKSKVPARRVKASTQIRNLALASNGFKKAKEAALTPNMQFENIVLNVIAKKIYAQIQNSKKNSKDVYMKLILFMRYPYSLVYRYNQIVKKSNESQESMIDIIQVQSRLKRIWNIHSKCSYENEDEEESSLKWCQHKQFILSFFGYDTNQHEYTQRDVQCERG